MNRSVRYVTPLGVTTCHLCTKTYAERGKHTYEVFRENTLFYESIWKSKGRMTTQGKTCRTLCLNVARLK